MLANARVMGNTAKASAAVAPARGRYMARPRAWSSGGVAAESNTAGKRQTKSWRPKRAKKPVVVQKIPQGWWQ
jgi:hypothetical protein